jgi:glucose-6-phosphate 1-epimerase
MTGKTENIEFRGQPAVALTAPDGAAAIIALHGATLLSWIPAGGAERLYLSDTAVFDGATAIRGGVPVIFPQFGARGTGPRHGFARTLPWRVDDARGGADFATATLRLEAGPATRAHFPHDFALEMSVVVTGNRLDLELEVENADPAAFAFSAALHTYLRVAEVELARLEGLRGTRFEDAGGATGIDRGTELAVEDVVDRIYFNTPPALLLREPGRALALHQQGFADTVVWNPWVDGAARLPDLPDNGFRRFLCVEAAQVSPLTLPAGQTWLGRQTLLAL